MLLAGITFLTDDQIQGLSTINKILCAANLFYDIWACDLRLGI
jgi:hypothetical protein